MFNNSFLGLLLSCSFMCCGSSSQEIDVNEVYPEQYPDENETLFNVPLSIQHIDYNVINKQPMGGNFFKNIPCALSEIEVVDLRDNDISSLVTVQVCQGILNQEQAKIYSIIQDHHITQFEDAFGKGTCHVVNDFSYNSYKHNDKTYNYSGIAGLLKNHKNSFKEFVLWDASKRWMWNLALMISSHEKSIPVTEELLYFLQTELNFSLPVNDIRNRWESEMEAYYWAMETYVDSRKCHPTMSFSSGVGPNLSGYHWDFDYAAASQAFTFYVDEKVGGTGFNMIQDLCRRMEYPIGSSVFGYGTSGDDLNKATNPLNVGFVVSDFYANGSFWCSYKSKAFQQRKGVAVDAQPGKIYVSFIWSDGDNIQFDANQLYKMFKECPYRGEVPVGFTVSPSLQELNPWLLEFFYKNLTPNDELLAGPSGFQFIYGDEFGKGQIDPIAQFEKWLSMNRDWIDRAGFHTACVWNTSDNDRYRRYMQTCGLQGIFDGNNRSYFYEKGIDGNGIVSISQGPHCWTEGDVYKALSAVKNDPEKPVFYNLYLIAANYGGIDGYARLKRELNKLETKYPNRFIYLLPMDNCATFNKYLSNNSK